MKFISINGLVNQTQNTEVLEIDETDLKETKKHLENRESVYIKHEEDQPSDVKFIAYEKVNEPWYLIRG